MDRGSDMTYRSKQKIVITTKTGDTGESGLANGQRVPKSSSFFTVIGDLDELNSYLGLVAAMCEADFPKEREKILKIQDTLFYIGAEVAQSPKTKLSSTKVIQLEKWQDSLEQSLEANWHTKFVLPGGTPLGAYTDIARTVCRRAERSLWAHNEQYELRPALQKYLNRLSDYLYILRCYFNQQLRYTEAYFESQK